MKLEKLKKRKYAVVSVLTLIILSALFVYSSAITNHLYGQLYEELASVTKEAANSINSKLEGDLTLLSVTADCIDIEDINDEQFVYDLSTFKMPIDFKSYAISDLSGEYVTTDKLKGNDATEDYFIKASMGEANISLPTNFHGDEKTLIAAVPIKDKGKVVGVLRGVYDLDKFVNSIRLDFYDDTGASLLLDNYGNKLIVIDSYDIYKDSQDSLVAMLAKTNQQEETKKILSNLESRISGNFTLNAKNEEYCAYAPLNYNNWNLFVSIPASIAINNINTIQTMTFIICILILIAFIVIINILFVNSKKHKEHLENIAYKDGFVNGYNKEYMLKYGKELLKRKDVIYAIISIDISKYRVFKNLFGSDMGDRLVKYLYHALENECNHGEIAIRTKSDNYGLLLEYTTNEELEYRIQKIKNKLSAFENKLEQPFDIELYIGIYVIDDITQDMSKIFDKAIIARRRATKTENKLAYYDSNIKKILIETKKIENTMHKALVEEQFKVYYQPKINLKTGEVCGAEALVRWQNDNGDIIAPSNFIPLFEENGFIVELDYYIFEKACRDIKEMKNIGTTMPNIAINISKLHLFNLDFVDRLERLIKKYGIDASQFEIEITESSVFESIEVFSEIITRLKSLGFIISLDDFGSGYSSLNLLNQLYFDVLKIDCEFLNKNAKTKNGYVVISSIIKMCKELGIVTVCEGVETKEQEDFLKEIGCSMAQGFYYDTALPHDLFINRYVKNKSKKRKK